ncbi:MAG TPA: hypothetical protein VHA57_08105 [Actinomycetota bacterium]|nr:hypothetical protein [Actinomycetota bacterium]
MPRAAATGNGVKAQDGTIRIDEEGELHPSPLAAGVVAPEIEAHMDALLARLPMCLAA